MPQELLDAFIKQMIESLDGISEALRILQQYCQSDANDHPDMDHASEEISSEQVRELLIKKSAEGKTERIREILSLFHAERMSDVNPKYYKKLLEMVSLL